MPNEWLIDSYEKYDLNLQIWDLNISHEQHKAITVKF